MSKFHNFLRFGNLIYVFGQSAQTGQLPSGAVRHLQAVLHRQRHCPALPSQLSPRDQVHHIRRRHAPRHDSERRLDRGELRCLSSRHVLRHEGARTGCRQRPAVHRPVCSAGEHVQREGQQLLHLNHFCINVEPLAGIQVLRMKYNEIVK